VDHVETDLICLPFRNVTEMCIALSEGCRSMCQDCAFDTFGLYCTMLTYAYICMAFFSGNPDVSCYHVESSRRAYSGHNS